MDRKKLRCDQLMPPADVAAITGLAPVWSERLTQRDGVASLLCSRQGAKPENALSFQVGCALRGKAPPEGYEALRQLHEHMPGARLAPAQRAVTTQTSHLALHPYRACFMQLVFRGPPGPSASPKAPRHPESLERLAALLASRVP